ncbi:MAG TPA: endopeptidase La [Succinivibrionaceae bacterium]|nr:endopeptidase La [Succinivibrio sp.]HAR80268.1 endopeptidase La [Succinivibrionaceae bacterium]
MSDTRSKNLDSNKNSKSNKLELPLVTLRGLTIVPQAKLQIIAARKATIAAFYTAYKSESKEVAVFCQLKDQDELPAFKDLLKTGVVCKVIRYTDKKNNTCQCLISGYRRIKLLEINNPEGSEYRTAKVELLDEVVHDENLLQENLSTLFSCLEYAEQNSEKWFKKFTDSSVPKHFIEEVKKLTDLSAVTDSLTQILDLDRATKHMLLSSLDPLERARIIMSALNGYSYKAEIENKVIEQARESMERNQREYFLNEQLRAIKHELGQDDKEESEVETFKRKETELKAPEAVHERLRREIKKLSNMGPSSSESAIVRNYIDTLLNIPWENSSEINRNLKTAQEILDREHYGLSKVKDRILEYLAVQAKADRLHGPILCLMGPPGIGKTSLGESIAKATGRKFVRVALGGVNDEAEIRGHRRTYVGALPGRIIQNLIKAGVNNPLFLLDEIDKVSESYHGDPSAALLEVLDPEQNKTFSDNYVELDTDLSNVMFVTTANSYNIKGPLLDRMEVIDLASYTEEEKFNIAKKHLIPKQLKLNSLSDKELEISDDAITELIRYYTHEAGVRGLERLINELCRKSVKEAMLAEGSKKSTRKKTSIKISKRTIDTKSVNTMLGPRRYDFTSKLKDNKVGLVNGLAWTSLGGDILQVEAVATEGKGKHILTGKLGEVMKESISAAITLVRSLAKDLHLDPAFYEKCDLHIHVPEGAIPKEGPSAGVGMVTAVVSAVTGNPVRADVAMTGEITLRGDVLPIGGLKEKLLAALRGGIKTVYIPAENEKDLWDVPDNVKTSLEIVPVSRIEKILGGALEYDYKTFKPSTAWKMKTEKSSAASKAKAVKSKTAKLKANA